MNEQMLQPLKIPSGWLIIKNKLLNITPQEIDKADPNLWVTFGPILLILEQIQYGIWAEIGWYPECDPKGQYILSFMIRGDYESEAYFDFATRSTAELVTILEENLHLLSFYPEIFKKKYSIESFPKNLKLSDFLKTLSLNP